MTIYSVMFKEKEKRFTTEALETNLEELKATHGKKLFKYSRTTYIAMKPITYTNNGEEITFEPGTRFVNHKVFPEDIYTTFTTKHLSVMQKIATAKVSVGRIDAKEVHVCFVGSTVFVHEYTNEIIAQVLPLKPEEKADEYMSTLKAFFNDAPSFNEKIRTSSAHIEHILSELSIDPARKPYDFLETKYILDQEQLSSLYKRVGSYFFNKDDSTINQVANALAYYQSFAKNMARFPENEEEMTDRKIAEVDDNLQITPSDSSWRSIGAAYRRIFQPSKGEKRSETPEALWQKYLKAIVLIMQASSIAHVTMELCVICLLKFQKDGIEKLLSMKAKPNVYDDGTRIILSVIWCEILHKGAELRKLIAEHGILTLLEPPSSPKVSGFIKALGLDAGSLNTIDELLIMTAVKSPLFIRHTITNKGIRFSEDIAGNHPNCALYILNCANIFSAPDPSDVMRLQRHVPLVIKQPGKDVLNDAGEDATSKPIVKSHERDYYEGVSDFVISNLSDLFVTSPGAGGIRGQA